MHMFFPPLDACMTPSGTMNTGPQEGGLQVRYSLDPLGPGSDVHGAFSNRNITFIL